MSVYDKYRFGKCLNNKDFVNYVVLFVLQIGLLWMSKLVYPQSGAVELIQMEFTGIDPFGNQYLFSIGILLLYSWLEIYILFQPINGFFIRYCYIYGRNPGIKKKRMAAFLSRNIIKEISKCIFIHMSCGGMLLLSEQFNRMLLSETQNQIQKLLCLEILHFMTLLIWGSFTIVLFYIKMRREYLWMINCLILCVSSIAQGKIVIIPFIPFNLYMGWEEQWMWKITIMIVMLSFQYCLLSKCCFQPAETIKDR